MRSFAIENAMVGVANALTGDRLFVVADEQFGRAAPRAAATTERFRWTEIRY